MQKEQKRLAVDFHVSRCYISSRGQEHSGQIQRFLFFYINIIV